MTSFSQSLCFGELSLLELEKRGVAPQQEIVKTPNRTLPPNNSDSEIIEESPTNCSTVYSLRDRSKNKQFNKSRTRKKIQKCVSSDQLVTSKTVSEGGLSQFFKSEYDFSDDVLQIVPKNSNHTNSNPDGNSVIVNVSNDVGSFISNLQSDMTEHDMFDESITEDKLILPTTVKGSENDQNDQNSLNILWDETLNDIDLNCCVEIMETGNANELILRVDEHIALGLDNVTFTQNFLNEASFENDLDLIKISNAVATSKFIEEEMENCKQSLDVMRDESQAYTPVSFQPNISNLNICSQLSVSFKPNISKVNNDFNTSSESLVLNYSGSSDEIEELHVTSKQTIENSEVVPLKHSNSIADWGLPASIVHEYQNKGIVNMFDWQRECLSNSKILFENSNLVYSAPTSAGKTLVSEIVMIKNVLEKKKKVLIILPFVSVAREKMLYLQDLLTSTGIQVEGYFGGYSPRNFDSVHVAVCTIEKANSIVNKLLEQSKINVLGCIVVDEVHLISDPGRGYILELLLTKILYVNQKFDPKIQVIAMSATLPNLELLTKWLDAEFYHTDYRPVELKEMIKINNNIYDNKMLLLRSISDNEYLQFPKDDDNIGQLCVETILESCSVVVFCPSKDWCESLANKLASFIFHIGKSKTEIGEKMRTQINFNLIDETKAQLRNCPSGLDDVLGKTLSYACAYHHAGLTSDERDIIENAFKLGSVRIIVATSTLSSGVNLPARRVIIRSPMFGGKTMNSLTYKQMIGRAGRTGKDTLGESILICNDSNRRSGGDLVSAMLKPLTSCLDMDSCVNLKRAILEIIAAGMATTKSDLEAFCNCTLLSAEKQIEFKYNTADKDLLISNGTNKIKSQEYGVDETGPIDTCMRFLISYEFIRLQVNENTNEINFISTRLGNACLASSMPPKDGFLLFSELQKSRQCFVLETELHAIYLVTPFSVCYQMQDIDWMCYWDIWENLQPSMRRVGELVGIKEAFFVKQMRGQSLDFKSLQIAKRFYTSLALQELVNEKHVNEVAQKFRCSRGLLQSLQQMASTFAGIVTSFCHALDWSMLATIISQFKERLFFGVHQDLVELMKIPNLNSQRARALFSEGIVNLVELANSDVFTIEKILYNSICFDSKKREGENDWEADQRNNIRYLFVTGKSGLTIREAAKSIIEDARRYLQMEMGVENIVWSSVSQQSSNNAENLPLTNETDNHDIKASSNSQQTRNFKNEMKRKSDDEILPEYLEKISQHFYKRPRIMQGTSLEDQQISQQPLTTNSNTTSLLLQKQFQTNVDGKQSLEFKNLNIVNVFGSLEFFNEFKRTIGTSSIIGVSIGVNRVLKVTPTIGINLLTNKDQGNETEDCYHCTFDNNKFIAGISMSLGDTVFYLNFQNEEKDDVDITFDMKINFLVELFHMNRLTIVMFKAKEQCTALWKCFPQLRKLKIKLRDPEVANWLLQPDVQANLPTMVRQYAPEYSNAMQIAGISHSDGSIGLNYNSTVSPRIRSSVESCVIIRILQNQTEHLEQIDPKMVSVFTDIEMPIQRTLFEMEIVGFPVDNAKIWEISSDLKVVLRNLEEKIFQMHGRRFKISSAREVAKVLGMYNNIQMTGRVSTAKQVLEKLQNPISGLIMQYRKVEASLKNIIQPLILQVVNNRIHPNSSCFTSTGRISMHEPNLQNVTNDFSLFDGADSGQKTISCRKAFQVCPGNQLISADFRQLELRILTHFSGDRNLTKIMKTNCDVFKIIAAKWNNIKEPDVTEQQRNATKQICYGIIYGMGLKTLAESLKCEEDEAKRQQHLFHECYPGIRIFTEKVIKCARENGFVETISGRRRYIDNIMSDQRNQRAQAERIALNTTIQGSAADIAKCAMLEMDKCLNQNNSTLSDVNLVLHMHDELIYETPKAIANKVAQHLKASMEKCKLLNVPLRVKLKIGDSWGSMKDIDI